MKWEGTELVLGYFGRVWGGGSGQEETPAAFLEVVHKLMLQWRPELEAEAHGPWRAELGGTGIKLAQITAGKRDSLRASAETDQKRGLIKHWSQQ